MRPGEGGLAVERELAAVQDRLRMAQRDGVAAMAAAGAIVALLALVGGWRVV